jgi:hypothetical protein
MNASSYSRTAYMAIKKETTENVAVTPTVFIPFMSEKVVTKWAGEFSNAVVTQRAKNYRPIEHAIDAPEGSVVINIEPAIWGHFLLGAFGAVTSGRYVPITASSGTWQVGETVTGGTSSNTFTILAVSSEDDYLLTSDFSGAMTDGETITGGTSSATATLTKADTLVYGHEFIAPQNSLDVTYTVEFGFQNEVHRFTGVRFSKLKKSQDNNVMQCDVTVMARAEFNMAKITADEASGAGSHTLYVDQTTGLAASDTIKVFRPSTGAFLDFSASSVKTHTVGTVASETSITITNLQTSLVAGDLILLAPQTPSYTGEKEFIWAGGTSVKIDSTITAALAASPDNIEDFDLMIDNAMEYRHAATGANLVNRFPAVVLTAGLDGVGTIKRTYTNVKFLDKLRSMTYFGMQIVTTGKKLVGATDFNYMMDIRIQSATHNPFAPSIAEDALLNQDMEYQIFQSTTDGYFLKILLVNLNTSY